MFILNSKTNRIHQKEITYTPGFYKIYDEILVNAADNKQRDPNMDKLEVNVDVKRGVISVLNNGKGIPVVMHKEHECYVPSLIFGQLLTVSSVLYCILFYVWDGERGVEGMHLFWERVWNVRGVGASNGA